MRRTLLRWTTMLAAAALALATTPATGRAGGLRLPDLDQETPSQLDISVAGVGRHPHYRLGFRSAVRNVGKGPLVIDGHRGPGTPTMAADQLIDSDGGAPARVSRVGWLSYVRAPTHQHWHLHGFDRYELRRAGDLRALVRDRKSGFCLGDRYRVLRRAVPGTAPQPVYTGRCGLSQPSLLDVREGISVGYGDDYGAHLEYQDLPLNGLGDGRYVLVHRVNADRGLRESNYANNAASLLLDLRWRGGKPLMRVLRTCPGTARCDRSTPAPAHVRAVSTGLQISSDNGLKCVLPPRG